MTKTFISLSKYPGTTGKTFYNKFFKKYSLDYRYEPIGTENLKESIHLALDNNVSGISISMPFKKEVITYLNIIDQSVTQYNSCNTILVEGGKLIGYNTDIAGVISAVEKINLSDKIIILGNGSIGKMFFNYIKTLGYSNVLLVSRSLKNYNERHNACDVLINCTSFGTINNESPIDKLHTNTRLVIDISIKLGKLHELVREQDISYFSGLDFYKHQFIKQFSIYTGINIDLEEFNQIANQND